MNNLSNQEIIDRVNAWQHAGFLHPLTCQHSKHPNLVPVIVKDRVILKCTECKYEQANIPPSILHITSEMIETNKQELIQKGFKF